MPIEIALDMMSSERYGEAIHYLKSAGSKGGLGLKSANVVGGSHIPHYTDVVFLCDNEKYDHERFQRGDTNPREGTPGFHAKCLIDLLHLNPLKITAKDIDHNLYHAAFKYIDSVGLGNGVGLVGAETKLVEDAHTPYYANVVFSFAGEPSARMRRETPREGTPGFHAKQLINILYGYPTEPPSTEKAELASS